MSKKKFRNFISLSCLVGLVLMFQNCGDTNFSPNDNTSFEASDDTTGVNCPLYQRPVCEDGESIATLENEHGCSYPVCQANKSVHSCPEYQMPLCDKGDLIVVKVDQNNCSYPKCEAKNSSKVCPLYQKPLCKKDEHITSVLNSFGCFSPICEKNKTTTCPVYNKPLCKKNEYLTKVTDKNGCIKPVCKAKKIVSCPLYNKPLCEKDEKLASELNSKGCSVPVCQKKDVLSCPIYAALKCTDSKTPKVRVDEHGCRHPYCSAPRYSFNDNISFKDKLLYLTPDNTKEKLSTMGYDHNFIRNMNRCSSVPSPVVNRSLSSKKTHVNFLAFGDPQIGFDNETQKLTKEVNSLNIKALNKITNNKWPKDFKEKGLVKQLRGVLIAGDLADHGYRKKYRNEFKSFLDTYGLCADEELDYPVYEGYGNHDITRGREMNHHHHIAKMVGLRNMFRKDLKDISFIARAHYSWRWDNVHFVNLNLKAGDRHEVRPHKNPEKDFDKKLNPRKALTFLKKDLWRNVGRSGRPIVIMMHYPPGHERTQAKDSAAFNNLIKHYNVIAIVAGHTHKRAHYKWQGFDVFETGGPFVGRAKNKVGHFSLFKITNNKLKVADIPWTVNGSSNVSLQMNKGDFKIGNGAGSFIKTIKMNDKTKTGLSSL